MPDQPKGARPTSEEQFLEFVCALQRGERPDPGAYLPEGPGRRATLIELARSGKLRFPPDALRFVDLDAQQINASLDAFQNSIDHVRTVIKVANDV